MISHKIALHSVQLPKTNNANVNLKRQCKIRSAIAQNEFENYKINTERANENKSKNKKEKQNKNNYKQIQPCPTLKGSRKVP